MTEPLIAAMTFCAPDTGAVKQGSRIPSLPEHRVSELREAGLIEPAKRAAKRLVRASRADVVED